MRKIISLFCLSFLVFQFACAEKEVIDPNAWDFGKAKQGEVLKHDFLFKNETKSVLNITSVNTSCGCTASQSDKKSLKPGEKTTINVSFNSHGYLGQVQQFVYVNTDNADLAVARFTIKAQITK
ncbi:MAG: DUF1573 domain-containing protein [Candidatus Omnitrophica bacterium]|nr:DUF1573 domain-containing protein [Candidatus Omnitrophota bacterium]